MTLRTGRWHRRGWLARVVVRLVFVVVLVAVSTLAAVLLARLAPGGADAELYGTNATTAERALARVDDLQTRRPGAVAVEWLARLSRFDFGYSRRYQRPVLTLVRVRAAYTAAIVIAAFTLGLAGGIAAATWSSGPSRAARRVVRVTAIALQSCPPLLLAIVLTWLAWRIGWLRIATPSAGAAVLARQAVVPILALAVPLAAIVERAHGRVLRETLASPVCLALRARGLSERTVRWRYAQRLAAGPLIALVSVIAGSLMGGSLAVELVTAWPGLGRLAYDAFTARDTALMAGCAAAAAAFVGVATFAGDMLAALIDPRVDIDDRQTPDRSTW